MFGWFKKQKGLDELEQEVKESFNHVKGDFSKVSQWIKHLDGKHTHHESEISKMRTEIDQLQEELQEVKDVISFLGPNGQRSFKQQQTAPVKQTGVEVVQTPVQTAVQTGVLANLSVMERGIVWALVNSEQNLSYEDLAALLGKDKSTIRGQINAIRQKTEGLIEEAIEANGKKRLYIPEKMKEFVVKSVKVRVKNSKKAPKIEKMS